MSTDQDKSGKGGGDRPALFGPANDPLLADQIERLTGDALDSTIARLDAFSDRMFSDTTDEDPFPFGVEPDEAVDTTRNTGAHQPAIPVEDAEAADGLDRILDTLSAEPDVSPQPVTSQPVNRAQGADETRPVVSLKDLERQFDIGEEILTAPTSPIADVLARTGLTGTDLPDDDYLDAEFERAGSEKDAYGSADPSGESDADEADDDYDPLMAEDISEDDLLDEDLLGEDLDDEVLASEQVARDPVPEDFDFFDPETDDPDQLQDHAANDQTPLDPDLGDRSETTDAGSESSRGFGLPEPSPYGDRDGMSGLYGYDEGPEPAPEREEAEPEPVGAEDWLLPDEAGAPPTREHPASVNFGPSRDRTSPSSDGQDGSALEGLISDLRWGRPAAKVADTETAEDASSVLRVSDPEPVTPQPERTSPDQEVKYPEVTVEKRNMIPKFLRRGPGDRRALGELTAPPPAQEQTPEAAPSPALAVVHTPEAGPGADAETVLWGEPASQDRFDPAPERADEVGAYGVDDPNVDAADAPPPTGRGRKRLLAGVALMALIGLAGAGSYLYLQPGSGPSLISEGPTTPLAPLTDLQPVADPDQVALGEEAATPPFGDVSADLTVTVTDQQGDTSGADVVATPPSGSDPDTASAALPKGGAMEVLPDAATGDPGRAPVDPTIGLTDAGPVSTTPDAVPAEVADLLAQISGPAPDAVAPGASPEQVDAIERRLTDLETISSGAENRAVELASELTGLTDQITGLLQRDSDQAERLDRMERLIRGQSAILAQFGQMEESLEQTQVVLLDVSARIGAMEGKNPADRDSVNRALADIESRLQALTANMSIIARMSIEGVDTLRAPGASSGTVGVQTSPPTEAQGSGGADTVFRTETGGFRISSDAAGRIPAEVKKDDFIEGYGYVLDVLPASDGQRLVVMENGSVLVPNAE